MDLGHLGHAGPYISQFIDFFVVFHEHSGRFDDVIGKSEEDFELSLIRDWQRANAETVEGNRGVFAFWTGDLRFELSKEIIGQYAVISSQVGVPALNRVFMEFLPFALRHFDVWLIFDSVHVLVDDVE